MNPITNLLIIRILIWVVSGWHIGQNIHESETLEISFTNKVLLAILMLIFIVSRFIYNGLSKTKQKKYKSQIVWCDVLFGCLNVPIACVHIISTWHIPAEILNTYFNVILFLAFTLEIKLLLALEAELRTKARN